MFEQLRSRAVVRGATSFRRFFVVFLGLALVQMLSGCIFSSERPPDLSLDIPPTYRAGHGQSAPPALDWWRGFRSAELTKLIEEAQTANFDIARRHRAHHAGRRAGQDRRRAAAARASISTAAPRSSRPPGGRRAATTTGSRSTPATRSISGARTAPPRSPRRKTPSPAASPGSHRALHDRQRRDRLFPGALVAGPAADRAQEPRRREPRARR